MAGETTGGWWLNAATLFARLEGAPLPEAEDWYRIADGYLRVRSSDAPFRDRLQTLFRECLVPARGTDSLPEVGVTVRSDPAAGYSLVGFDDPEPLDQLAFILELFADRGFTEIPTPVPEWKVLGIPTASGSAAIGIAAGQLLVPSAARWQSLAGSLAFSRLIRLQRELLFFHAGSVGLSGRGMLLIGPKGSGKTTLSLALAARGHDFLGDEMAGVRIAPLELVPIRRSLAVRDGLRGREVDAALERVGAPYEPFPDGTERRRAYAGELFPSAAASVTPLTDIVFLQGFAPEPRLHRAPAGREQLGQLTPLGATMWGANPLRRARELMSLVTRARCWTLTAGDPDATAVLLEHSLEE